MARPSKTPVRYTRLGEWINQCRADHGDMTLEGFADLIGFSHGHVSKIMRGKAKPSPHFLEEMAKATNATENELLIIAFGQPRVERAQSGARRIISLSSSAQEALRGVAAMIAQLPPDEQLLALDWFKALAKMSQSDRTKAIREITAYLKQ